MAIVVFQVSKSACASDPFNSYDADIAVQTKLFIASPLGIGNDGLKYQNESLQTGPLDGQGSELGVREYGGKWHVGHVKFKGVAA